MRHVGLPADRHRRLALATPASRRRRRKSRLRPPTSPKTAQTRATRSSSPRPSAPSTVQDVPFSINAQTRGRHPARQRQTIEDISRNVAGLTVQNLGPGQSQVSVRGVSAGQIVRDQPGVKEQVGVYLDEIVISLSLFTPDFDLFDLNRVETLRGPQGTLFGSGASAARIRYITNQPNARRDRRRVEGDINVVDEGDIGCHLKGAINVPLGETAAFARVGYGTHYRRIHRCGRTGRRQERQRRRAASAAASRCSSSRLPNSRSRRASSIRRSKPTGSTARSVTTSSTISSRRRGRRPDRQAEQYLLSARSSRDETFLADLTASYDFGAVELTSVTSYINRDILVSRDASALTGSVGISTLGLPVLRLSLLPSNLRDTTDLKQFTQELRLASTGDGPFQWVFGGFYSERRSRI